MSKGLYQNNSILLREKDYKKKSPKKGSSALAALQRMCSMCEVCTFDARQKLQRMEIEGEEADVIIASLTKDKFIDDARYASAFVRDKSRLAGWGSAKIKYALRLKKVSDEIITESLTQIGDKEQREQLLKILTVKMKSGKSESDGNKLYAKLMRFALSRGFSYETASWAVTKIIG